MDDSHLLHCWQMARLQSDKDYRKDVMSSSGQYNLGLDLINLVHAKKAQALASDQDYKTRLHSYTVLPDDMKVQWAKKAYDLQSQVREKEFIGKEFTRERKMLEYSVKILHLYYISILHLPSRNRTTFALNDYNQ